MRWTVPYTTVLVLAGLAGLSAHAADRPWQDGLLAYLPLDGSLDAMGPAEARAGTIAAPQFGSGVVGEGLIAAGQRLEMPASHNFSLPRGSVAFFLRPAEPLAADSNLVHLAEGNFVLSYQQKAQTLFFMTGRTREVAGFAWDYSTTDQKRLRAWEPGKWHHLAATWDSSTGRKALYLDGEAVSTQQTDLIRSDEYIGQQPISFAADRFSLDELMVWNRVLEPAEVRQLATAPAAVAGKLCEVKWPARQEGAAAALQLMVYPKKDLANAIIAPGGSIEVPLAFQSGQPETAEITWQVVQEDFFGRQILIKPVRNKAGGLLARVAPEASGIYRIHARADAPGVRLQRDIASVTVLPEAGEPDPQSFSGHHVNAFIPELVQQAARGGASWNRDHNMLQFTWWPRVQPEPGDFTWALDKQHELMQHHGMQVLGQIFGVPYWAAAGKQLPRPQRLAYPRGDVPDLDALQRYVDAVVRRYPDVGCWEIWNEPEVSTFFQGTPEQFAELAQRCTQSVRAAKPDARVMVGGFTQSNWPWHEKAAAAGALRGADAISFHAYFRADAQPEELYSQLRKQVDHFRSLGRQYEGRELALWDTESGCEDTTFLRGYTDPGLPPASRLPAPNWRQAAVATVQHAVFLQHLQVERSFLYVWNLPDPAAYVDLSVVDLNHAPKPRLVAHLVMQRMLRDARPVELLRRNEGRLWAGIYRTPKGSIAVLFTGRGGAVSLAAPGAAWTCLDLMGNALPGGPLIRVDEVPLYLRMEGSPEQLRQWLSQVAIAVERDPQALPCDIGTLPAPTMPPKQ